MASIFITLSNRSLLAHRPFGPRRQKLDVRIFDVMNWKIRKNPDRAKLSFVTMRQRECTVVIYSHSVFM